MADEKDKTKPGTITLYPDDWNTIQRIADTTGVRTISAALRIIIREFECKRQQQINQPETAS